MISSSVKSVQASGEKNRIETKAKSEIRKMKKKYTDKCKILSEWKIVILNTAFTE